MAVSIGPLLWPQWKCLNNSWMERHDILFRYSWFLIDTPTITRNIQWHTLFYHYFCEVPPTIATAPLLWAITQFSLHCFDNIIHYQSFFFLAIASQCTMDDLLLRVSAWVVLFGSLSLYVSKKQKQLLNGRKIQKQVIQDTVFFLHYSVIHANSISVTLSQMEPCPLCNCWVWKRKNQKEQG